MLDWLAGDPALRDALEAALAAPTPLSTRSASSGGRRHLRVDLPSGESLFLKRFPAAKARRPLRSRLARGTGLATAQREWRTLEVAHAAGVPVPSPRALVSLPGGDLVLATDFVSGPTLAEWLPGNTRARRALLDGVGSLVGRLHAAGIVHRDLHAGNILVSDAGPVLVDLQAARRSRSPAARSRDVGELDYSVSRALSLADRVRLGGRGLGLESPFDPEERRRLRAAARATAARARAHATSRTRRSLRPGRRFAELRIGSLAGLRLREIDPGVLERALDAHAEAGGADLLKLDARARISAARVGERAVVIKEHLSGGLPRRLADRVRGSAARRAWRGGHGLLARGIGAATPLAFLERRIFAMPLRSVVILEDLRPAPSADALPGDPETLARALTRMLVALHRAGVCHGDLKASHVFLETNGERLETRLIDLEGVRFRRVLTDADRIRALAQLNASLPDALPDALRREAFERYAAALPFREPADKVLRRVVEQSLARAHRWMGGDCARAIRGPGARAVSSARRASG